MTSVEIANYFIRIDLDNEIVCNWIEICKKADMAKYAKQIPNLNSFKKDKIKFVNIIKLINDYKIKETGVLHYS